MQTKIQKQFQHFFSTENIFFSYYCKFFLCQNADGIGLIHFHYRSKNKDNILFCLKIKNEIIKICSRKTKLYFDQLILYLLAPDALIPIGTFISTQVDIKISRDKTSAIN